jgi:hypothetical protein
MSRSLISLLAATLMLIVSPRQPLAQDRSYDESALRLEYQTGDVAIVRGSSGPTVARIGMFPGSKVSALVSDSPNAVAEAKIFERDYVPGSIFTALGIAAMGAAIGTSRIGDVDRTVPVVLSIGSLLSLVYGARRLENAYRALSRSIWWYNKGLMR